MALIFTDKAGRRVVLQTKVVSHPGGVENYDDTLLDLMLKHMAEEFVELPCSIPEGSHSSWLKNR